MTKVRYSLQTPKEAESLIRLVLRYAGEKLVFYPGYKIKAADWNSKEMRIRRSARHAAEINAGLARLSSECERLYLEHKAAGKPLPVDRFRALLNQFWKGIEPEAVQEVDLIAYTSKYIQERIDAGKKYNLLKGFKTLRGYFEAYRDKRKMRSVPLESVDLDFLAGFVAFLRVDKRLAQNTVAKAVNRLKTIMGEAYDRGYTKSDAWRSKRFSEPREETDAIYLTETELAAIAALDLSDRPHYERTRDSFLFGAYTGLRYSDFSTVRPENIVVLDGVRMVRKRQAKTRRMVAIPLFSPALAIVDKYGGSPPVVNQQVMNRRLKEIARLAGITERVQKSTQTGEFSAVTGVEKWSLVTTHTARRSFATNEYLRASREGRDWRQIMDITGHSTERQFFEYVKVRADVRALGFAKAREAG